MRCLALAGLLRDRGAKSLFLCAETAGHLCDFIEDRGFPAARMPISELPAGWKEDAEHTRAAIGSRKLQPHLLVVDHYKLDARWERALRSFVGRIFVFDDLADRSHDCDVLLDQNLHDCPELRYKGLVSAETRVFVGPRFALMRPEFETRAARLRDQGLQRLLVFFGGIDPTNEAFKLVSALRILGERAPETKLVLGPINPGAQDLRRFAASIAKVAVIGATDQMAKLITEADLGIGTCGISAWERCWLGLPALVVISADHQRDDARILQALGAVRCLGDAANVTIGDWVAALRAVQTEPAALLSMSHASAQVMRGRREALRDLEAALVYP